MKCCSLFDAPERSGELSAALFSIEKEALLCWQTQQHNYIRWVCLVLIPTYVGWRRYTKKTLFSCIGFHASHTMDSSSSHPYKYFDVLHASVAPVVTETGLRVRVTLRIARAASAAATLPPSCCRRRCRTAAVIPAAKLLLPPLPPCCRCHCRCHHCRHSAAAALPLPPPCHRRCCHAAAKLPSPPPLPSFRHTATATATAATAAELPPPPPRCRHAACRAAAAVDAALPLSCCRYHHRNATTAATMPPLLLPLPPPPPLPPRSLASHRPPSTLPSLVDWCFLPLPQTGGVWGHHLPLLFTRLVLIQCHRGCGVITTATAIPVLADGQFWPSPSPGACRTGTTHGRGGGAGMPSFDAVSIALVMVLECFVCDERSGLSRVYVKSGTNV